jgi:transposase
VDSVVAVDEGRCGLKTWLRRRWCPSGERPPWVVHEEYAWRWLYAAIEPTTGTLFGLLLPGVDSAGFETFLQALRTELGGQPVGVVLDNAPSHHSQRGCWPERMAPIHVPAYRPELNPVEPLFRQRRQPLAKRVFADVDARQDALPGGLRAFWEHPEVVVRLTAYSWWVAGCRGRAPLSP